MLNNLIFHMFQIQSELQARLNPGSILGIMCTDQKMLPAWLIGFGIIGNIGGVLIVFLFGLLMNACFILSLLTGEKKNNRK